MCDLVGVRSMGGVSEAFCRLPLGTAAVGSSSRGARLHDGSVAARRTGPHGRCLRRCDIPAHSCHVSVWRRPASAHSLHAAAAALGRGVPCARRRLGPRGAAPRGQAAVRALCGRRDRRHEQHAGARAARDRCAPGRPHVRARGAVFVRYGCAAHAAVEKSNDGKRLSRGVRVDYERLLYL